MATDPRTIIDPNQDPGLSPQPNNTLTSNVADYDTREKKTVIIDYTDPPLYGTPELQIFNDPGGSNGQVQFNKGNRFGGDNNLVWNAKIRTLSVLGNIRVSGEILGRLTTNITKLKITGGNIGDVLTTDGLGNISWTDNNLNYGNTNVANYLPIYTGNVSANYFIGNGSQLTGLPTQYANSNVANYLPTYTGNLSGSNLTISNTAYIYNISSTGLTSLTTANVSGNFTTNAIYTNNYFYANGEPFSGGGSGSELVNGNNSFVLDGDGNVVFEGDGVGQAVNRGLVWDYGANANGVNSMVRQDGSGLTVRAYTEDSGNISASVNIVTNQDANAKTWIFDGSGNLTLPGNLIVPAGNIVSGNLTPTFNSAITGITTGNATVIVTLEEGPFSFPYQGEVTISSVTGTAEANGTWYYEAVEENAFELFVDSAFSIPVDGTSWTPYVSGGNAVSTGTYTNLTIQGNISIGSNDNIWTFNPDGNLTLAGGNSVIQSITNSSLDPENSNVSTMVFTPDALYSSQSLVLDPTGPSHIHLRAPGANIDEPDANIFLGGEESSFEVGYYNGNVPNLYIHSGGNTWTFGTDGNLTFPSNGSLNLTGGGINQTSNEDLFITTFDDNGIVGSSLELSPGDTTRMEQWSSQQSDTFTTSDWTTGVYINPGEGGAVQFTGAANIIAFIDSLAGVGHVYFSVNGGTQLLSDGISSGGGNITFYTLTPPATDPTVVTSFEYFYSYNSGFEIVSGEGTHVNIYANDADITLETTGQYDISLDSSGDVILTANSTVNWTFSTTGNLTLPGNTFAVNYANGTQVSIGGGANTGNVTFDDQVVVGTGDGSGGGGLYLAPGTESVANLQYWRVRGGDVATHMHLDTGNNAYFDQYFGDDIKYVKLEAAGNVQIGSNDDTGNSASWTFGVDGNLTLPQGTTISDATDIVTVTLDQFTDGGFAGTQVFTKVSDTLYELSPGGPYMTLISAIWRLKVSTATYYDSTDLITWGAVAGGLPTPVGTLTTLATMNLGVGGNVWAFGQNGNLTLPSGGVIYETNIPGGELTGNTIVLKPQGGTNADQQLLVYPTTIGADFNHLHLTSGNLYNTELFLGSDDLYVKLANTGNIVLNANDTSNSAQWTFGFDSNLTLPGGSKIIDSPTGVQISGAGETAVNLFYTKVSNTLYQTVDAGVTYSLINQSGTWSLDIVGLDNPRYTSANLITWTGGIAPAPTGTIINGSANITVSGNTWTFGANGIITVPGPISGLGYSKLDFTTFGANTAYLTTTSDDTTALIMGPETAELYANTDVSIRTNTGGTSNNWTFGYDGGLRFPRDASNISTDPILTITGGANPTITSTDASLAGPAPLAISADSVNISGFNGNRIIMSADAGEIITDLQMILVTNAANSGNTSSWTFGTTGVLTLPGGSQISETANVSTNITVNANAWAFGIDGILTLPGSLVTPNGANAVIGYTTGTAGAPLTITAGDGGIAATGWNSGEGGDLTITAGDAGSDIGNPSWGNIGGTLVLRGGNSTQPYHGSNVEIYSGNAVASPGVISLHTGTNQWTFGSTGNLTLPNSATIIAPNTNDLTLRVTGQYNICTLLTGGSGYGGGGSSSAISGGTGTGMIVGYGYGLSGQVVNVGVTDPGTGYSEGDVLTMTAGNGGATFVITKYNTAANAGNDNTAPTDWIFGNDINLTLPVGGSLVGNLIVPGSIVSSGASPAPYISGFSSISALTLSAPTLTNGNSNVTVNANSNLWTFDSTGNLTLPANAFAINYANGTQVSIGGGSSNTGNVTFDDINVIGTGNLKLQPDSANANAYLDIFLTAGPDIHIAGNGETVILGTDNFANVAVNVNGNVSIQAGDANGTHTWNFDTAGNLTLPLGSIVYETNIPDGALSGSAIALKPIGGTTANQQLLIYPTAADGDHIHMTSGNLYATELFLGSDNLYVKLANTGNVVINSNDGNSSNAMWTFDTDGNLTLPGNLVINGLTNVFGSNVALLQSNPDLPLLSVSSGSNGGVSSLWVEDIGNVGTSNIAAVYVNPTSGSGIVRIAVGQNGSPGPNLWDFNANGILSVPGNINSSGDPSAAPSLNDFFSVTSSANFAIVTDNANTDKTWNFDSTGNLTLPANIVAINFANGSSAFGNIVATNLDSSSSNVLYGNGIFAAIPIPTVTPDITSNGDMSIMTYDGVIKSVNYATIEPSSGNIKGGNLITTGNVYASNVIINGQTLTATGAVNPDYINMTTSAAVSVAASGTDLTWDVNNGSSGIAYSAGKFSLTTGKTYHILVELAMQNYSASGYLLVELVDGTSNARIGSQTVTLPYNSGFNEVNNPTLDVIHTPVANQDVKLRVTGGTVGLTAQLRGGGFTRMSIVQLNPTASLSAVSTISASGNIAGGNISTTGNLSAGNANVTGNLTAGNASLGNLVTANYFAGTLTTAAQPNITSTGTLTSLNVTGTITGGNLTSNAEIAGYGALTLGNIANATATKTRIVTAGTISYIQTGNGTAGSTGNVVFSPTLDSTARVSIDTSSGNLNATGNISANNFLGNGAALTGVVVRTTGTWTVATGTNTYSITVPINGNYQIWVRANIPNGIIAYQATVSVTNTNVPVLGTQRAWNYTGGGSPILITTMPTQIVGAEGTISTTVVATTTANVFDFVINNSSGSSQTVSWGYATL